ncbi:hypothetical protein [Rhizobium sp. FKY42]|uniref:hypothetical protein n=1 Tax=Rhizobium sp. FKY42 TaxID=2562310 RepID=UPI0010C14FDB|nr:hypothetical protein [Rhizobium sp. FKY42]
MAKRIGSSTSQSTKDIALTSGAGSSSSTQSSSSKYIDTSKMKGPRKVNPNPVVRQPRSNDDLVRGLQNYDRSAGDAVGEIPDVSAYVSKVQAPPINETDKGFSMVAQSMTAAPDYAENEKTINDKQFEFIKEGLKDVDRSFINPDTINNLDKLTADQKAAYMVDLIEAKQMHTAYMNQYGDSVPNGDEAGRDLDARLDVLMKDSSLAEAADQAFSRGARAFLTQPENDMLLSRFKDAYFADIVGGKAIDRALASGKSLQEAFAAYSSELNLLTKILPQDYLDKYAGAASLTLSQLTQKHLIGDGTGGDLSPFTADANGNSATLKPAADAMALQFMAQNVGNKGVSQAAIKLNYAKDITRNVDGVIRLMRTGMKMDDALASVMKTINGKPSPLGIPNDIYKAGLIHGVQTLTMASVLTARAIGNGPKPPPHETAAAVASSVQIVGMMTEGLAKNLDAQGKAFSMFGTGSGTWGAAVSKFIDPKKLEAGGKILGGVGGLAMAGLAFYSAHRALKGGEKAEAAFQIINGVASLTSGAVGLAEVALQFSNVVPRLTAPLAGAIPNYTNMVTNGLKFGLSAVGRVAGVVGSFAGFALGLIEMAKGAKKLTKLQGDLNDRLRPLIGKEVTFEFRPRL